MKPVLQKLCLWAVPLLALLSPDTMRGQIDYGEDFSAGAQLWTGKYFEPTTAATCDGNGALRARVNNLVPPDYPAVLELPSIGISNGEELTLTYTYRLLYYDAVLPAEPVGERDFGAITLEYAPTVNGPWAALDRITLANYERSDECTERIVAFTPPEGSNVYLRFRAGLGTEPDLDYLDYLDNINAVQSVLTVAESEPFDKIMAYPNPVIDYLHIEYDGYIDDVAIFNMQGQEVNAVLPDNGASRLDLTGLASGNYIVQVISGNELKTLNIVKN